MDKHIFPQSKSTSNAFTLVELVIVIALIGILAVAGGASYTSTLKSARDARRKTDMENIRSALETYRGDTSTYPTGIQLLDPITPTTAVLTPAQSPTPQKKYISLPKDPKHNTTYVYEPKDLNTISGVDYWGNYVLGTYLENIPNPTCALGAARLTPTTCRDSTGVSVNCNYCLDPYGKK